MIFRLLMATTLGLALAWSGYWWIGANRLKSDVETWMQAQRDAGWVAEAEQLFVTGYPNRFDIRFESLHLADTAAGWSWEAPALDILSLSYRPDHLIVTFPGRQILSTPEARFTLEGQVLRASVEISGNIKPERIILEGSELRFEQGAEVTTLSALSAAIANAGAPEVQRLGLTLSGVVLSPELKDLIDPTSLFPPTLDRAHFDATIRFDTPLVLPLIEELPLANDISLRNASLLWGNADINAQGELTRGPDDRAIGTLDLSVREWEQILEAAEVNGALGATTSEALRLGLSFLANLSGDDNALEGEMRFRDGSVQIGPFQVAPSPRLRLGN